MSQMNPLFVVDCYKVGHPFMYAENMQFLESNMTARSSKHFKAKDFGGKVVVLGIAGMVQEYFIDSFNKNFFERPITEVLIEYSVMMAGIFGEGVILTDHIRDLHNLGYLPLTIHALPEGSLVDIGVPFIRVNNTKKGFAWLVNYCETLISNYLWPMMTNATTAYEFRKVLQQAALDTVGEANPFVVGYQAHDFSLRGLLDGRSGSVGFAHLPSFIGSDNVPALFYAKKYYNPQGYIAGSVPATEHSVASSNILNIQRSLEKFGEFEGTKRNTEIPVREQAEELFILKMITEKFPTGIFSYVTDTFDYWQVLTSILPRIKPQILARVQTDSPVPTRFVIRPDSGNPVDIICGIPYYDLDNPSIDDDGGLLAYEIAEEYSVIKQDGNYYEIDAEYDPYDGRTEGYTVGKELPEHVVKGSIEVLWDIFGGTETAKGYKQLDSKIGLIYGDSINLTNLSEVIQRLKDKGFASTNVIFGVGSFSYQYVSRDTFGMAIKATHAEFEDSEGDLYEVDLYKDPKTDDGTKKSAKGRLAVFKTDTGYKLVQEASQYEQIMDAMDVYFMNGDATYKQNLDEIRTELLSNLPTESKE